MRALSDSSKNFPTEQILQNTPVHCVQWSIYCTDRPVKPLFQNPGYCTFSLSYIVQRVNTHVVHNIQTSITVDRKPTEFNLMYICVGGPSALLTERGFN